MKAKPVTSVALEIPLESDVLLELLDQQVPHPDRLYALGEFAARQSAGALACPPPQQFDAARHGVAGCSNIRCHCRLSTGCQHGDAAAFRSPAAGARNAGKQDRDFGDRSRFADGDFRDPAYRGIDPGNGLGGTPEPPLEPVPAGASSVRASSHRPTGVRPFGTGVSSDVTYPRWAPDVAADVEAPPLFDRLLPLTFAKRRKAAGNVPRVEPIRARFPRL